MASGFNISGIDVYRIKTLSGVNMKSDWEIIKEFDFTKAPNHNFTSSTPSVSFGGVTWTQRNLSTYGGADSYVKFIEGTGLQIFITGSTGADSNFISSLMTDTLVQGSVSDIATAAGVSFSDGDTLCYQVLLSSSFNNIGRIVTGAPSPGDIYNGTTQDGNNPCARFILSDGDYGPGQSAIWGGSAAALSSSTTPHSASWNVRMGGGLPVVYPWPGLPADHINTGGGPTKWPRCMEIVAVPAAGYVISLAHTSSTGKNIVDFPRPITMESLRSSATTSWQIQNDITNNPGVSPDWALKPSNSYINMTTGITLWISPVDEVGVPVGPGTSFYISAGITTTYTKLRILRRTQYG